VEYHTSEEASHDSRYQEARCQTRHALEFPTNHKHYECQGEGEKTERLIDKSKKAYKHLNRSWKC
jgi:hypothetical protein